MPSKEIEKIKWAPNQPKKRFNPRVVAIIAVVLVICGVAVFFSYRKYGTTLTVNNDGKTTTFHLQKVTNEPDQERGLGDAPKLPLDKGMIFWYNNSQDRCFWMKNMRYSLDMIWLDASKKVVHLEQNVAPETYPSQQFCAEGQYIIELNAGEAAKSGIDVGKTLSF